MNRLERSVVAAVQLYQDAVSPRRGPTCRFAPTCSSYAIEAIQEFGLVRGAGLALRRLSKCHPFHAGGYDPVPVRRWTEGSSDRHARTTADVEPDVWTRNSVRQHGAALVAARKWESST